MDKNKKPKIQYVLRSLIEKSGHSARQVAKETGIPASTLNSLLSGSGSTKPEHLYALAKYFGTSMEFILFGEDDRPPTLDEVLTEQVFDGWLRVRIDKAIPSKRKA